MALRNVFVVGGAGYIGSHAAHFFQDAGCSVTVYDDLSTGHRSLVGSLPLVQASLSDSIRLKEAFSVYSPHSLLHFAANCLVEESEQDPLKYYRNNVAYSIQLFRAAIEQGCRQIIFSSTAAVYGVPEQTPIREEAPKAPINTYGRTKLMIEQILQDLGSKGLCRYAILRYFNAAGASSKHSLGEDHDPETHLIPNVLRAADSAEPVSLYGKDYPTLDGTCVRDFIHVDDLAQAHYLAWQYLQTHEDNLILNLGSGKGYSVREVIETAQKVTGREILVIEKPRRAGDPAVLVADTRKAKTLMGWVNKNDLGDMVCSAWAWHQKKKARPLARASSTS